MFLIETVRSKKGFSFHSIILSLTRARSGSVKGQVRRTTYFEFLVFFVSFPGGLLELPVLTFLEFNIPLECYDALSEAAWLSSAHHTLDLVI